MHGQLTFFKKGLKYTLDNASPYKVCSQKGKYSLEAKEEALHGL